MTNEQRPKFKTLVEAPDEGYEEGEEPPDEMSEYSEDMLSDQDETELQLSMECRSCLI